MLLLTSAIFTLHALGRAQVMSPPTGTNSSGLANVTMAFTQAQVVPDVISTFNPVISVDPIFMDTSVPVQVVPDILLTMNQTQSAPQWFLSSNNTNLSMSNASWVITIVDPDAPTPQNPNISQFLHFIGQDFVVDPTLAVTGGGLTNVTGLTNTSEALVEFFPPTPPAGSDPHRYVILVYVQPDDFNTTAPMFFNGTIGSDASFRQNFSISDFATNTSLGNPVAGNFFLVGPASTNQSSTTIIPSATVPRPVPSSTLPMTIVSQLSSPAISPSPTNTAVNTTSGAERVTSWMPLIMIGILSVAFGLFV